MEISTTVVKEIGVGWKILGIVAFVAFFFKVYNERQMTKMYERQAVALERLVPSTAATVASESYLCGQGGGGSNR